jgi:hypothetical protein
MPSARPLLTATVDDETRDLWRDFANFHGVSVSALIEAIGRYLVTDAPLQAWQRRMLQDARVIDAERRSRR